MNKNVFVVGLVLVFVMGVVVLTLVAATSTARDDECSAAYRECEAMVDGIGGIIDCRIEVAHCRSVGHFEFPDGSTKEFPVDSANVGEN